MNPAFSVIFLTVFIGAGQGLFVAVVFAQPHHACGMLSFGFIGSLVSLSLLFLGLFASFFHLGRPERAWRAATMWRTSWLSREVIVLPLLMIFIAIYAAVHWPMIPDLKVIKTFLGFSGIILVTILFACTGMIYACVKFLQEWASPWTLINFTLMGVGSGFVMASAISASMGQFQTEKFVLIAVSLTLISFACRMFTLYRNAKIKFRSNIQSAIGIKHQYITQRSMGMTGGSFNTKAFFNHASYKLIQCIKLVVVMFGFVLPLGLLGLYLIWPRIEVLWLAVFIQFCGLVAERWLFFAQANHPQNLYYQTVS